MRKRIMTPLDPTVAIATPCANRPPQSALQITREAIARWTGVTPAATLPKDVHRVSPQARHLEQARRDLAAWIADGGFAQDDAVPTPLAAPVMYRPPSLAPLQIRSLIGINACMD
jgi:hypothetical protein